jgi:hypothetical protein
MDTHRHGNMDTHMVMGSHQLLVDWELAREEHPAQDGKMEMGKDGDSLPIQVNTMNNYVEGSGAGRASGWEYGFEYGAGDGAGMASGSAWGWKWGVGDGIGSASGNGWEFRSGWATGWGVASGREWGDGIGSGKGWGDGNDYIYE